MTAVQLSPTRLQGEAAPAPRSGNDPVPLVLPPGTVSWVFFTANEKVDIGSADGGPGKVIWRDLMLLVVGDRVARAPPKYVEVYAVRADGSVVRHRPVSEETPVLFHKAPSVFRVLGPGNFVRLRLFTNVHNVPSKWPKEHKKVPQIPGMVLVVVRGENGERHTRHVFLCPTELDFIWGSSAERARATIQGAHKAPKKRTRRDDD